MSSKDKARELVNFYTNILPFQFGAMEINLAKQCATKVVEEIILSNPMSIQRETLISVSEIAYWKDVLEKIKQ